MAPERKIKCDNRAISFLIFLFLSYGLLFSQHPINIALYELLETGDFEKSKNTVERYSIQEIAELPDSTLLDYFYLKACILQHEGNEKGMWKYLIEAKNLCEKSQSIHSPLYLELCWAIGNSFEREGDNLSAFEIYQAALIQSRGLYSLDDEDVKWQYEYINNRVIEWYQNDDLRRAMIEHRVHLSPREVSKDAVQNDMEFYYHFYKDEVAKAMMEKADSVYSLGKWDEAARIYLDVAADVPNNLIAKATVQELASTCLINVEDFQRAEDILLSNLKLLENYTTSKEYRRTLSQLSNLYSAIHNYSKAKIFAEEAKFQYEKALDFSRGYILCLHRCATLERGNENYFLALLLEDVALQELYKNKVWGEIAGSNITREAFLTNCLSSAALHYNQFGFLEDAYQQLEEAIDIAEQNGLDASTYYKNLGDLCIAARDFDKAVISVQKAYDISHSENNKIQIGTTLCMSQFLARQPISANVIKECSEYLQSLVNKTFAFTSTEERRNFWSYFEYYFPLLNFLAYQTGQIDLNSQIYNNILVEKGLLLRTTNNIRDQILSSGISEDIALYDKLLQIRNLLPSLSKDEAKAAKAEIERIDKYLTKQYFSYASFINGNEVKWSEIQDHLIDEDIAIEFYNIPEVQWHEDGNDVDGKSRYCAVTLRKGYDTPHIIPLFTEDKLDGLDNEDLYETDIVYNLIWKPLEEELKGVKNIYFAADRELHKIGIEYVTTSDGKNIGDLYNIHRLSSTRVLAENRGYGKKDKAVIYGGIKYDTDVATMETESRKYEHPKSRGLNPYYNLGDSLALRGSLEYLNGSLIEAENINDMMKEYNYNSTFLSGNDATEESFKSLSGQANGIIHISTHGFYWTESEAERKAGLNDRLMFMSQLGDNSRRNVEDKALTRTGLFMAGAKNALGGIELPDDVDDGILTAQEIANLDLRGLDLVVLSACQTGMGDISGDGVFGLQRGFKKAGANSILMSLWDVSDTATPILMTEFYRNYLSGKSKQESLRLAQQYLRNYTDGEEDYSDPKYWAAFILLDGVN